MTIATPTSEHGVIDALRAAGNAGLRVHASGGARSATESPEAMTLSTLGLTGIVALRPSDLVVTVRAGTTLVELDAALRHVGCELPLAPWNDNGDGTIGGAVAAGADGLTARNGYRWRDVILGARVALPTGAVIRVGASVVKSVAGFDVARALCGSHGELGVITCLELRIDRVSSSVEALTLLDVQHAIVADTVALIDTLPLPPRGLVVTAAGPGDAYALDVLFAGSGRAVREAVATLRSGCPTDCAPLSGREALSRWPALVRRASQSPPGGLHRRVSPMRRRACAARSGGQLSGHWLGDLARGRATWVDSAPDPPPEALAAALYDRVRRAFDPVGILRRPAPDPAVGVARGAMR